MVVPSQKVNAIQCPDPEVAANALVVSDANLHVVFVCNASVFVKILAFPERANHRVVAWQAGILAYLMKVFEDGAIQRPDQIRTAFVLEFITSQSISFGFRQRFQHAMGFFYLHKTCMVEQIEAIAQLNYCPNNIWVTNSPL